MCVCVCVCVCLCESLCGGEYIYIYTPLPKGLSNLLKELTVATCVIQDSTNELSTSVSDSVKCKQMEVNTYTLNSLDCVLSVGGCEVMLSV